MIATTTPDLRELPDNDLAKAVQRAQQTVREIDALDAVTVVRSGSADETLARYSEAVETVTVGEAELARRAFQETKDRLPLMRQLRDSARRRHPAAQTLRRITYFAHPELRGEKLVATNLSDDQAEELTALVQRRLAVANGQEDATPPTEGEIERYEQLVGIAVERGDEEWFPRKRRELEARGKLASLQAARRRHPQADSLVAAILSDPSLWDLLHERLRKNVRLTDEYGRESVGVSNERILGAEHVSALYLLLSRIVENGGKPIIVGQHGLLDRELPLVAVKMFSQLRRNGLISLSREGAGWRVGLGERSRQIAARWGIEVP